MSVRDVKGPAGKKPASAATNLMAGGGAGMMEALACHPLGKFGISKTESKHAELRQIRSKSACSFHDEPEHPEYVVTRLNGIWRG